MTGTTKTCTVCSTPKPLSEFNKDKNKKDGLYSQCKACVSVKYKEKRKSDPEWTRKQRERSAKYRKEHPEKFKKSVRECYLRSKYGISTEEYDDLLTKQSGRCALCSAEESSWGNMAVDHCHATGRVRGLLCFNCNTALGKFGDDVSRLRKAIEYLEET